MSWETFQLEGFTLTEADNVALTKDTIRLYKQSIKDINELIKTQYAKYLASIGSENFYNEMLKYNRLGKLYSEVIAEYTRYSLQAGVNIANIGRISMSNMYYRTNYQYQWLQSALKMPVLPNDLINLAVAGTDAAFKSYQNSINVKIFKSGNNYMPKAGTLGALLQKNRKVELKKITDAITNGLVQGQSYTAMAESIRETIGITKIVDGKFHASGSIADAMRIIRTESTRIMNDGAFAAAQSAKSQGLDIKKMWLATLDSGTRPVHAVLDGQVQELDKEFDSEAGPVMRPGQFSEVGQNARCRCSTVDILNDQKPSIRRGRVPAGPNEGQNEVFEYQSFNQWAKDNNIKENRYGQMYI